MPCIESLADVYYGVSVVCIGCSKEYKFIRIELGLSSFKAITDIDQNFSEVKK
jgi:hypothetical protein